jgi:tetratricopeptide (TPR) repeat protein
MRILFGLALIAAAPVVSAQVVPTPDFRRGTLLIGPNPVLAAADAAWLHRDEGRAGARASALKISEAITGYEKAAEAPGEVEARWKLVRALFFKAKFTGLDRDRQLALYDKARKVGEEALEILRSRRAAGAPLSVDAPPSKLAAALSREKDSTPAYFWTAAAWGEWALLAGKLPAARIGAATKIRDYARTVIALDPAFEDGGGYRILGRLHHQAPRIPYLTGWVSRAEAVRNLRLAVRTAPRNFVNRHFLAEALADGGAAERSEAFQIERDLATDAPSPGHLVEDLAIQDQARRNLLAWRARS